MDLFAAARDGGSEPLASRMRPRTLEEFAGQAGIVGPGRLLRRAIQADRLSSLILWGPPGTGKTSLGMLIAGRTEAQFIPVSAVLAGVKELREAIQRAEEHRNHYGRKTILFVDEVHRWNKSQQDALLPWVENGTVILIGATTENPYFEVNRALVSRSRVFRLEPLGRAELLALARRALSDKARGYGNWDVRVSDEALEHLADSAGGDARCLLNALELAVETTPPAGTDPAADCAWPPPPGSRIELGLEEAEESIQRRAILHDRDGDYHYDVASAFIKSVRGSDPDAALYWLARMVRAGEDPHFAFRRMLISACEDVGMADPQALGVVEAAAAAFDRVGFPEGNFHLAHAALYLATAPKSNSSAAFFEAIEAVESEDGEVPNRLKDASRDGEELGHGKDYLYPHAFAGHWVAQDYLPATLRGRVFYRPSSSGHEGRIRDELLRRRELQLAAMAESGAEELFSARAARRGDDPRGAWEDRGGRAGFLGELREAVFALALPSRTARTLIVRDEGLALAWESLRRSPGGLTAVLAGDEKAAAELSTMSSGLEEIERPVPVRGELGDVEAPRILEEAGTDAFDLILSRGLFARTFSGPEEGGKAAALAASFAKLRCLLAPGGLLVVAERPPALGQRLSAFLPPSHALRQRLAEFEEEFFGSRPWLGLGPILEAAGGFSVRERRVVEGVETRRPSPAQIDAWTGAAPGQGSAFAAAFAAAFPADEAAEMRGALKAAADSPLEWRVAVEIAALSADS